MLYLATTNPGKVREFASSGLTVALLPGMASLPVAPETGDSFAANAIQKALFYAPHSPGWLIAEDSGIEVEALGGAPGIHSARWAGNDAANNAKLLAELASHANRRARYVCAIALVEGTRTLGVFSGTVEGEILHAPQGSGGFGYDPLFYYPPFQKTFAQTSEAEKFSVSHRGRAIAALALWLRENASIPDSR